MVTLLENPLRVGLRKERVPEPQILVIFGASGDLTQRKLVPAIYQMKRDRRLPPETTVVGVARRPWSHDYFREQMREGTEEFGGGIGNEEFWQDFAKGLYYCPGDIDNPESYQKLKDFLAELDEERELAAITYFISQFPRTFSQKQLGNWARLKCWQIQ